MEAIKTTNLVRVLPWGEEIYLEIPLNKNSSTRFYGRHGKTGEGREYIEFFKFGPRPNGDGESYMQKLRLFGPTQWAQIKYYMEGQLAGSIGWDLGQGQKDFEKLLAEAKKAEKAKAEKEKLVA